MNTEEKNLSQTYIMPKHVCPTCCGTKMMMGGGMIKVECRRCNGTGKLSIAKMAESIDRAADEMVAENPELSKNQATAMIGESLNNSAESEKMDVPVKKKRGRQKGWKAKRTELIKRLNGRESR